MFRTTAMAAMALIMAGAAFRDARATGDATVIELTQTPCQFLEPEGGDKGFKSTRADDCKKINRQTGKQRLAAAKPLVLKPGKYVFRVTNKNVPYPLGFYLRAANVLKIPFKPKVSGGGMTTGKTLEYEIELTPGEYVYSCPLNPTPDYPLIVKE